MKNRRQDTRLHALKTKSVTVMKWSNIMPPKRLKKLNNQRNHLIQKKKIKLNLNLRREKIKHPLKNLQRRRLLKSRLSLQVRHQQRQQKRMQRRQHQKIKSLLREVRLHLKLRQKAPKLLNQQEKIPKNLQVRKKRKHHQPKDKRRIVHQSQLNKNKYQREDLNL